MAWWNYYLCPNFFELKNALKKLLQRLLGFKTYLKVFARYKIRTLRKDSKEGDFFKFMSLLKDEGLILDIGANLGIMSWHLLSHFQKAEIWAFEPIPENSLVLEAMTEKFQSERFRIYTLALGAEPGRTKMVLPEVDEVKMQGLSHVMHSSIDEFNTGKYYEVEIDTLDNIIGHDKRVQGIKLDVENFEYFVLSGGKEMIRRDKPIIYTELWDNTNRQKCLQLMREMGYAVKYFDGKNLEAFSPEKYAGQNFFFLPGSE